MWVNTGNIRYFEKWSDFEEKVERQGKGDQNVCNEHNDAPLSPWVRNSFVQVTGMREFISTRLNTEIRAHWGHLCPGGSQFSTENYLLTGPAQRVLRKRRKTGRKLQILTSLTIHFSSKSDEYSTNFQIFQNLRVVILNQYPRLDFCAFICFSTGSE